MENGQILDTQLSASSQLGISHEAINGRLNFRPRGHRQGAWTPRDNNHQQWFQVNFAGRAIVTEILTQGSSSTNWFVYTYAVSYSRDGVAFTSYHVKGHEKVKSVI